MAYLLEDAEDEDKQGGGAEGGAPLGGGMSAPSPMPGAQQGGPSETSGYVGWDRILNANKDAATAQSSKMAEGLEKQAKDVQSGADAAQQRFQAGVAAGGVTSAPVKAAPEGPGTPKGSTTNQFGQPTGAPQVKAAPQPSMPVTSAPPQQQTAQAPPAAYTGPNSLADDSQWAGILGQGKEAASRLGAAQSEGGLESLLTNGQLGNGGSRMDAALLGSTGRGRFAELQQKYGGLLGGLKDSETASRGTADAMRSRVAGANADAQRMAAERSAALNKGLVDRDSAEEAARKKFLAERFGSQANHLNDPAYLKDREGKESYDKYMGTGGLLEGHKLEHTIQDVGRFLNPVYGISDAAGGPSIEGARTPYYEGEVNKATGSNLNSQAVQLDRQMPGTTESQQRAVYESLTTAEVKALEGMGKPQQHDFLMKRLAELQKTGQG